MFKLRKCTSYIYMTVRFLVPSRLPGPYILRCRRTVKFDNMRETLNSRLHPPGMLWDRVHDCTVYRQRMHTSTACLCAAWNKQARRWCSHSSECCNNNNLLLEKGARKESTASAIGEQFVLSTVWSVCHLKNADIACMPCIYCLWQQSSDLEIWREHLFEFVRYDMNSFEPEIQCSFHP